MPGNLEQSGKHFFVLVQVTAAVLHSMHLAGAFPTLGFHGAVLLLLKPENDFLGVVVDSNRSTEFKKNGDSVFWVRVVPTEFVIPVPPNISVLDVAGFTLAAETAYQALFDCQTVFINGGSSSVGAFAIQIAKAKGIRVVASASAKNEDFVRKLGVDDFIDYTKQPLHTVLVPSVKYDCISDVVGLVDLPLYTSSPAYLAPNGTYVSTGPYPHSWAQLLLFLATVRAVYTPRNFGGTGRTWKFVRLLNTKSDLVALQRLIAEGKVNPVVDSVFDFEDVHKAYERL
ncbi:hypothetical protein C8J57DRAFT_1454126 [Mycena rebaudengoi]|nr:hypothetical protein C8J57DRAFT_1454126 [Mycena rebaudengoi]